jgi:hypothetical protein
MAAQTRPIRFGSFAEMAGHLDGWAARTLTTPEAWQTALVGSHDWLEFAPRNQALLLSYEIDGPAAGMETWRFVPSTENGRGCGIRAGEHGYPIRVPITTGGMEPDPFVGGTRPTRSQVERWEWRPVFSIEQLARKPIPGSLVPVEVPEALTGPSGRAEYTAAVGRVVTATVRGRLPRSGDPDRMLADAAGRLRRSSERPELIPVLREQVAWLVAERVGHAPDEHPPPFDPSQIKPRERWERLIDVLDPARRLTASLGVAVGVDLVGTPLPRMQIVDDRVVPAGRRHRLPASTLDALPLGRWVPVGPYTQTEWAARGELGSGNGAFLRLNKTAYVAAVENGDTVTWRLEDVAARTGNGRLATGTSRDLTTVRGDVAVALGDRYPALTQATEPVQERTMRTNPIPVGPVAFDYAVAALADSEHYTRDRLVEMVATKLSDNDCADLSNADHARLATLLGSAGLTAATTVAVLYADGCSAETAATLMPTIGVPMSDAIRALNGQWNLPNLEAAQLVGATGREMRAAGCSATEVLTVRPESILRALPNEPHLWELAAGTMATTGHSPTAVVGHLINHAPDAVTFAAGLTAAIDDPTLGVGLAARLRAQPEFVSATSERYGLTPAETATILRDERVPMTQALATLAHRCGFDDAAVIEAWSGRQPEAVEQPSTAAVGKMTRITSIGGADIGTADELLALLPSAIGPSAPSRSLFETVDFPTDIPELLMMEAAKP